MASVSVEFKRLDLDDPSPALSSKHWKNKPYFQWQIQKVSSRGFSQSGGLFVTAHFSDEHHQQIPLGQFVQLANYRIDHLVYDLKDRIIDFAFKDSDEGAQFSKRLESCIKSPIRFTPLCPPSSPRETELFDSWEITDAEATPIKGIPAVVTAFDSLESRNVSFNQLVQLAQNHVSAMRVPLATPRIDFLFLSAAERNSFLERINQHVRKVVEEQFHMKHGSKSVF